MKVFTRWLFCLLLLFIIRSGVAQGDWPSIHFDHLTIGEGLSHNTVYCLLQDQYGYIWIGTQNGLNRYDGYDFEVFRSNVGQKGNNGFVGKGVTALFEDSKGNLWVGTRKNGINLRENLDDYFVNLNNDPAFSGIAGSEIASFFEDSSGNIWIATINKGVLKYNPEKKTSIQFTQEGNNLFNNLAFDVIEDENGTIWVGTAGQGLNYLPKGENKFRRSNVNLPNDPNMDGYRKKLLLDNGYIWIGIEGSGLYRMEIDSKRFTHFQPGLGEKQISSSLVRDLHKTKDGFLYVATDGGGLNIFDPKKNEFAKYSYQIEESSALNSNALFCFLEDRSGNLWIGSYDGGVNVYKVNKTRFDLFTPRSGGGDQLEHRSVLSVYQTRDGKIWVGTDGGGLSWLNQENNSFSFSSLKHDPQNPNSLGSNIVKTIFEDSKGQLWIGTFASGMSRFDQQSNTFKHFRRDDSNPNSLGGNNVWSITERKDGKLWVGTVGAGLAVFDPDTERFRHFLHDPNDIHSVAESNIMTLFVANDDKVWVGTIDNGLDIYDEETGHFIHFKYDPKDSLSLSNNEVRAIFQDSRGEMWVGTEGGGLNRWLGNGKFERITIEQGLIANSVMGITEDEQGNLWITSFEGLSVLDKHGTVLRSFHFHQGLTNNQFNQMSVLAADNGQLFFGGINGLHTIRPEQVKGNSASSKVIFTDFRVFNESLSMHPTKKGSPVLNMPVEITDRIKLNYLDKSFTIDFSAIDFTAPLENRFMFRMQGFDDNWQQMPAGQHSVTYTNLDPGTYTFAVKHKNQEQELEIYIKPPFWETLWFKLIASAVIIAIIFFSGFFIIKRREEAHKQQLLEAESEILQLRNEKLAADLDAKNSKLMYSSVQMAHKNEILSNVKQELKVSQKETDSKIPQLIRMLDRELKSEDYWKEFNLYFNQVDKHFTQALVDKHANLTPNDIRLCSLIRINLSTKEIASLLNVSTRAVEQSRYRLKKRLSLGNDEDLSKYISGYRTTS